MCEVRRKIVFEHIKKHFKHPKSERVWFGVEAQLNGQRHKPGWILRHDMVQDRKMKRNSLQGQKQPKNNIPYILAYKPTRV